MDAVAALPRQLGGLSTLEPEFLIQKLSEDLDEIWKKGNYESQLQNSEAFPGLDFAQAQDIRDCRLRRIFIFVIEPHRLEPPSA